MKAAGLIADLGSAGNVGDRAGRKGISNSKINSLITDYPEGPD